MAFKVNIVQFLGKQIIALITTVWFTVLNRDHHAFQVDLRLPFELKKLQNRDGGVSLTHVTAKS